MQLLSTHALFTGGISTAFAAHSTLIRPQRVAAGTARTGLSPPPKGAADSMSSLLPPKSFIEISAECGEKGHEI